MNCVSVALLSPRLRRVVELKPLPTRTRWPNCDCRLHTPLPLLIHQHHQLQFCIATCTWWLFLQGRRQEKDKRGWRCCSVKEGTATEGEEGTEESWRREAQPSRKSLESPEAQGFGKDSWLEVTFLPQLVFLTVSQSGQGACPSLTGLWAPSPWLRCPVLSSTSQSPFPIPSIPTTRSLAGRRPSWCPLPQPFFQLGNHLCCTDAHSGKFCLCL